MNIIEVKITDCHHTWYKINEVYKVFLDPYVNKYMAVNSGKYIDLNDCVMV
jgi:hypothetical protein